MRYLGISCIALFAPLLSPSAHLVLPVQKPDATPHNGPRLSVWIADFENKSSGPGMSTSADPNIQITINPGNRDASSVCPVPDNVPSGLAEMAITELVNSGYFDAVERDPTVLQNLADEQHRAGVSSETRTLVDKIVGAQLILKGALTEISFSKSEMAGSIPIGFSAGKGEYTARVDIDVRLIDASSGEIYAAAHGTGGCKSTATALTFSKNDYNFGSTTFKKSPFGDACRQAILNAIVAVGKQSSRLPAWQAKVAVVDAAGKVYINAGKRGGLRPGDIFEIFHPGESIPDPDDPSKSLGETTGVVVGKIKIVEVLGDRLSRAVILEGSGFAAQDRVRIPVVGG